MNKFMTKKYLIQGGDTGYAETLVFIFNEEVEVVKIEEIIDNVRKYFPDEWGFEMLHKAIANKLYTMGITVTCYSFEDALSTMMKL